jgi:TolB protein
VGGIVALVMRRRWGVNRAVVVAAWLSVVALACVLGGAGVSAAGMPSGRIVFSRGLTLDRYEIWTVAASGGNLRRLTRGCGWDWFPSWAPGRGRVAFTRACNGTFSIYVVRADGSGLRRATPTNLQAEWPTWSPDGKRLAFAGGEGSRSEIYVVGADGLGLRQLTHNDVADSTPAWSPSGRTLLFSSKRGPDGGNRLMLMPPSGGAARALPLRGGEPAWSPDGTRIAWAQAVRGASAETDNVWVASANGSCPRQLTHEQTGIASHHPTWSPDGRTIAFMSDRGAAGKGSSLWQIKSNGTEARRLTHSLFEDADPDW